MKLCRFTHRDELVRAGLLLAEGVVLDLSFAGAGRISDLLEHPDLVAWLEQQLVARLPHYPVADVTLLPPVDQQEVWAAGVTYLRSKTARMEESEFSQTAYDRVYEAPRPEIFFKSLGEKISGPLQSVGIRRDARWSVPEPELALCFNSRGELAGCTIGNDMSSRDIEGENLLYLPQAKIYRHSCALGPCIVVGCTEAEIRQWGICMVIRRAGQPVFAGETSLGNIQRSFGELGEFLFRCQDFPRGAILLTGTGIVPEESFTLQPGDHVEIEIPAIGILANPVVEV